MQALKRHARVFGLAVIFAALAYGTAYLLFYAGKWLF